MDFLFDIGNVIVGVDFIPALTRIVPAHTSDVGSKLDLLIERKDEFEAGRISPSDYFPWAAEQLGFTGSHDEFIQAWVDIFSPNEPMWAHIKELHEAGHRLILFSNINNPHKQYLFENYPVFQYFTGGIFSYQTGHIKPEPEIYELAIKQYNLNPTDTVYIDDLPANIEGGKNAGFLCHQYCASEHEQFARWLDSTISPNS